MSRKYVLISLTIAILIFGPAWADLRVNVMPDYPGWTGKQIILFGNVHQGTSPYSYRWVFGDGSSDSGAVSNTEYIAAEHTYSSTGDYQAILTVWDGSSDSGSDTLTVSVYSSPDSDVRRRAAIEDGLRWLYVNKNYDADSSIYWDYLSGRNPIAATASAVHAFELQGYLPSGNIEEEFYAEYMQGGIEYLLKHSQSAVLSAQPAGNPDLNGNGIGAWFNAGTVSRPMYEIGIAMMAIVETGTPDQEIQVGEFAGRSYSELIQDCCDYIAWGQNDYYNSRGGWRYLPNYPSSDNSNSQFPAIGLEYAEHYWGIKAADFVKTEEKLWLGYSQNDGTEAEEICASVTSDVECPPILAADKKTLASNDGGFGYHHPNYWVNPGKTGGGLVQMAYAGYRTSDSKVHRAVNYLDLHWNDYSDGFVAPANKGNYYAMYSIAKGCIVSSPPILRIGERNWRQEYVNYLVDNQNSDGSWPGHWVTNKVLSTAWAVYILGPETRRDMAVIDILEPPTYLEPGQQINPTCAVGNLGTKDDTCLVECVIDSAGVEVYTDVRTGVAVASFESNQVRFSSWKAGDGGNIYTVTFTVESSGDEDPTNDQLSRDFYTAFEHDLAALRALTPDQDRPVVFPDSTYEPSYRLRNVGTNSENDFYAYCIIDSSGVVIYEDSSLVTQGIAPFDSLDVSFSSWRAGGAEAYDFHFYHLLATDQDRGNDSLELLVRTEGIAEESDEHLERRNLSFEIYPSVGIDVVVVKYQLPSRLPLEIEVFDAEGRLVRRLLDTEEAPLNQALVWDLTDDAGRRVPAGTYFYRFKLPKLVTVRKGVLINAGR